MDNFFFTIQSCDSATILALITGLTTIIYVALEVLSYRSYCQKRIILQNLPFSNGNKRDVAVLEGIMSQFLLFSPEDIFNFVYYCFFCRDPSTISRDELRSWFLHMYDTNLTLSDVTPEIDVHLQHFADYCTNNVSIHLANQKFWKIFTIPQHSVSGNSTGFRYGQSPANTWYRPLVTVVLIKCIHWLSCFILTRFIGLEKARCIIKPEHRLGFFVYYPNSSASAPTINPQKPPIGFFGGFGFGLIMYVPYVYRLKKLAEREGRGLIVPEWEWLGLMPEGFTNFDSIPSMPAMTDEIRVFVEDKIHPEVARRAVLQDEARRALANQKSTVSKSLLQDSAATALMLIRKEAQHFQQQALLGAASALCPERRAGHQGILGGTNACMKRRTRRLQSRPDALVSLGVVLEEDEHNINHNHHFSETSISYAAAQNDSSILQPLYPLSKCASMIDSSYAFSRIETDLMKKCDNVMVEESYLETCNNYTEDNDLYCRAAACTAPISSMLLVPSAEKTGANDDDDDDHIGNYCRTNNMNNLQSGLNNLRFRSDDCVSTHAPSTVSFASSGFSSVTSFDTLNINIFSTNNLVTQLALPSHDCSSSSQISKLSSFPFSHHTTTHDDEAVFLFPYDASRLLNNNNNYMFSPCTDYHPLSPPSSARFGLTVTQQSKNLTNAMEKLVSSPAATASADELALQADRPSRFSDSLHACPTTGNSTNVGLVVLGHSYGTAVASTMCKRHGSTFVKKLVLMDPICFFMQPTKKAMLCELGFHQANVLDDEVASGSINPFKVGLSTATASLIRRIFHRCNFLMYKSTVFTDFGTTFVTSRQLQGFEYMDMKFNGNEGGHFDMFGENLMVVLAENDLLVASRSTYKTALRRAAKSGTKVVLAESASHGSCMLPYIVRTVENFIKTDFDESKNINENVMLQQSY